MPVDLRQTHFRFGKDDGTEAAHTWWAAEDTNASIPVATNFLLRFTEQEAGATAAANTDATFEYNKNGAGWNAITTSSSVVRAVAVTAFANGDNCTKRLSGTGTFESSGAGCTEDGTSGGNANDIAASGNSETECGLNIQAADVVGGDTIQFRFTSPDWSVTYTVTPTLNVVESVEADGAATGTGAATGVGFSHNLTVAASAGIATDSVAGVSIFNGVASSAGVGAASGDGEVASSGADAASAGTGAATGVGVALWNTAASVSGIGAASGVGVGFGLGDGQTAGVGAASGIGVGFALATASTAGSGAALGTGVGFGTTQAQSSGVGAAAGESLSFALGTASSSGSGAASGASVTFSAGTFNSQGVGTALGVKVLVLSGYTRDSLGAVLGSCVVHLFRTATDVEVGETTSSAGGYYQFEDPAGGPFYAVAYKAGSPDVAGTTVNTLVAA